MARARLNRDEFFDMLSGLGEAELQKALWTLYWRGSAALRDRVEAAIDPPAKHAGGPSLKPAQDPELVLGEVTEFASLARKGAYLAGDRRVSPKERTRWRHTFRRLAAEAQDALRGDEVGPAVAAVSVMIDLACESRDVDYFRSEDPVEAARFVVSDLVRALWIRTREEDGSGFAERAAEQLLRWESEYGWTRRGDGWVAARETTLGRVLSDLLLVPDLWARMASHYLQALDRAATGGRDGRSGRSRQRRAEDLREWHALLIERLIGSDHAELLDQLVTHQAIAGPEVTFLQARLARDRGDEEAARSLVQAVPGIPARASRLPDVRLGHRRLNTDKRAALNAPQHRVRDGQPVSLRCASPAEARSMDRFPTMDLAALRSFGEHFAERADRPFGDVDAVSGRTLQPFSIAGQQAAANLLSKAQRALDEGDLDRARAFVDRAVRLPYDKHEQSAPAATAAHMELFCLVTDTLEQSENDDSGWLDAAVAVLASADEPARCDMRDVLAAIDQDYSLTSPERSRIHSAIAVVPDRAELRDLVLTPTELGEQVVSILAACGMYRAALKEAGWPLREPRLPMPMSPRRPLSIAAGTLKRSSSTSPS